jgi:NADPH-dependent glutamate synthase beta subunit-like oxidoreductase
VTVRDGSDQAGGMMRFGIPAYRLPRDVLDLEVARIVEMGVTLELGVPVTDLATAMRDGKFDAAFLAFGAQLSKRAYIPAGDSARVLDALNVLRGLAEGDRPQLGRRVVVYGGGNTAMDVAGTARRLGATEALVIYRRTREKMPAQAVDVDEAVEEGVGMRWLSTIAYAEGGAVGVEKMRLDETGFPQPTGEYEQLPADSVVLAIGQEVDRSIVDTLQDVEVVDGVIRVGPDMMTGHSGVFAGGDLVAGERTVMAAVGHGKRAAGHIDAWLRGVRWQPPRRPDLAGADRLHPWYYSDAPATVRPRLETAWRICTFDEVVGGLDEATALFEARRCLWQLFRMRQLLRHVPG